MTMTNDHDVITETFGPGDTDDQHETPKPGPFRFPDFEGLE